MVSVFLLLISIALPFTLLLTVLILKCIFLAQFKSRIIPADYFLHIWLFKVYQVKDVERVVNLSHYSGSEERRAKNSWFSLLICPGCDDLGRLFDELINSAFTQVIFESDFILLGIKRVECDIVWGRLLPLGLE
jgi:hypothetical protein